MKIIGMGVACAIGGGIVGDTPGLACGGAAGIALVNILILE